MEGFARVAGREGRAARLAAGGAAGGFVLGLLATLASGNPAPILGGIVAGVAATVAVRVGKAHLDAVGRRFLDSPEGERLLGRIRSELDVGVVATRRAGFFRAHGPRARADGGRDGGARPRIHRPGSLRGVR